MSFSRSLTKSLRSSVTKTILKPHLTQCHALRLCQSTTQTSETGAKRSVFQSPWVIGISGLVLGYAVGSTFGSNNLEDTSNENSHDTGPKIDPKWLDNWELYYHPKQWLGGRGQYVRYLFLLGGANWTEPASVGISKNPEWDKLNQVLKNFPRVDNPLFPCLAPPWIVHEGRFLLSHTPVITRFLAEKFDLLPDNDEDAAHCDQIAHQIYDALNEAERAYHPIDMHATWKVQWHQGKFKVAKFLNGRLTKHLLIVENTLSRNGMNGEKGWLFGNKLTYADALVALFMRAYEASQPDHYKNNNNIKLLKKHRTRFEKIPAIKEFINDPDSPLLSTDSFMG